MENEALRQQLQAAGLQPPTASTTNSGARSTPSKTPSAAAGAAAFQANGGGSWLCFGGTATKVVPL